MRSPILGCNHLHDGTDKWTWSVVLASIASSITHVPDLGFVQVRQFVLLGLRTEAEFVNVVDDLAHIVATGDLVLDLSEDLADLVLDGVWSGGFLLEAVEVREELLIDEVTQVVTGEGRVVVELAVFPLRCSPGFPTVGSLENVCIFFPSSAASSARSCSRPSRYFRNSSQDVCSV